MTNEERKALAAEGRALAEALAKALEQVIDATRSYLPPDGISESECISRILAATDNPKINKAMKEMGQ